MNFIKYLSSIVFIIVLTNVNSQGVLFDDELYSDIPNYESNSIGFSSLPNSISLRDYAPPVMMQSGNSCTGYAVAYSALSIMHNIQLGITKEFQKRFTAFDPYFIYSISHFKSDEVKNCNDGTYMGFAFINLKSIGCKKLWMSPLLNCNKKAKSKHYSLSTPFSIKKFEKFDKNTLSDVNKLEDKIKIALNSKKPVVIGLKYTNSMQKDNFKDGSVNDNGLWQPSYYDKFQGGHAVTIIGYDDDKFGGSYEIMNSWGDKYGDNGFMWIKYKDLKKVIVRAYVMEIKDYNKNRSQEDYYCTLGDGYHGYVQVAGNSNSRKVKLIDANFKYGFMKGHCISIFDYGVLINRQKNNKPIGRGYFYNAKNKILYSLIYRNGKVVSRNYFTSFGFAEDKMDEEDLELKNYVSKIYNGEVNTSSKLNETDYENISNQINSFFEELNN